MGVESTEYSRSGWRIKSDKVDLFVTTNGGHLAPVNFIEGAVRIPDGFENVKTAGFGDKKVTFVSITGEEVVIEVNYEFLKTGKL